MLDTSPKVRRAAFRRAVAIIAIVTTDARITPFALEQTAYIAEMARQVPATVLPDNLYTAAQEYVMYQRKTGSPTRPAWLPAEYDQVRVY